MDEFYLVYLKYKKKYLDLKKQLGGTPYNKTFLYLRDKIQKILNENTPTPQEISYLKEINRKNITINNFFIQENSVDKIDEIKKKMVALKDLIKRYNEINYRDPNTISIIKTTILDLSEEELTNQINSEDVKIVKSQRIANTRQTEENKQQQVIQKELKAQKENQQTKIAERLAALDERQKKIYIGRPIKIQNPKKLQALEEAWNKEAWKKEKELVENDEA